MRNNRVLSSNRNRQKFLIDIVLNIISSTLPLLVLQFFILPITARIIESNSYGMMLTMIGFINIGMGVFGSSLNNTRLLEVSSSSDSRGNFNVLLSISMLINHVILFLIIELYSFSISTTGKFLYFSSSFFIILTTYLSVEYRINLSYIKILIKSVFQTIGFLLGAFIVIQRFGDWHWIYFLGYGLEFLYVLFTTKLLFEPYVINIQFNKIFKRYIILILSTSIGSFLVYYDRIIIYPLFGGTVLAIYYASTIVGKTVSMISSPLTSVLISYTAKISHIPRKRYIIYSFSAGFTCCIGYFFCRLISNPLILLLYPDYLIPAQKFIPITIMISMLEVYYSFIWPIIFRFGKTFYPLIIASIKAIIYISFSILLVKTYNVMAICYAGFISSLFQASIIFVLGLRLSTRG